MSSNRTRISVTGNLVSDPERVQTRQGDGLARFRLAVTSRSYDAQDGWRDDETSFYGVSAFGALGANVLASLRQGHGVVVTGDLRVREWVAPTGGGRGREVEIRADAVGPNLRFTAVQVPDRRRAAASGPSEPTEPEQPEPAYVVAEASG